MVRYAATIFVSAFLLFQVQPMVARFILPWFGGSSLVWTTCMLFFQMALVFGYAYSHFVSSHLSPKQQLILHGILLATALVFLPIQPSDYWKPETTEFPTTRILALLAASVGLPFFLLSTTGPLIQAWQSKTHPDKSPFRLFALSNAASLLALISYPFVFERFMSVRMQSIGWSVTFAVFALFAMMSAILFVRNAPVRDPNEVVPESDIKKAKISPLRFALWLLLPALASVQLLATTNLMTQEIGSLPFLWILPLSLYLISFIICFDHQRWYIRPVFYLLFFASTIYACSVLEAGVYAPILHQVLAYSLVCFGASMCCHGELARIKPHASRLTLFYLCVSVGGAIGGILVALVAPNIFVGYYEFQIGLFVAILSCLLAYGIQTRSKPADSDNDKRESRIGGGGNLLAFAITLFLGLLTLWMLGTSFSATVMADQKKVILAKLRNEYGTLTVKDYEHWRTLNNGRIQHGTQSKDPEMELEAVSYYGPDCGLDWAIAYQRDKHFVLDFGAIGLGIGTVSAFCRKNDRMRFYEINPAVVEIAKKYFTYLGKCEITPEIVLGDGRLQMEREIKNNDPLHYDVLIADAFSSDSIPMHLLTLESMQIYEKRLKHDGILCFHTSNRFLKLENIVKNLAEEIGMQTVVVNDVQPNSSDYNSSTWVLVTNNKEFIDFVESDLDAKYRKWPDEKFTARWTDDFSSIIPVINWDKDSKWFRKLMEKKGYVTNKEEEEKKAKEKADKEKADKNKNSKVEI